MVKLRREKNTGNCSTHMAKNGVIKEPLDWLETQLGINLAVKMVFLSNQLGMCIRLILMKTATIHLSLLTTMKLDVNNSVLFIKTSFKVILYTKS